VRAYAENHFQPIANQKHLSFKVEIAPDAPATLATDGQRLEQILNNLLSNAFKFTETGSVELRLFVVRDMRRFHSQGLRRAQAAVAFALTDTGIGIPRDKQALIFEAFQQADSSTSRVYGGTGLGLTISRELARLIGGEIHLRSTPGVGSTFTLYVPISHEEVAAAATAQAPAVHGAAHPTAGELFPPAVEPAIAPLDATKVLVVDDDVRNLFAVTSLLEQWGAKVLPAKNAQEAFEVLERSPDVALVLMDMMMPEVDGYEATRQIRAKHVELPIIALTAKAMPGDREKALDAGCNDFVPKPLDQNRLIAVLRQYSARG
jgi:CheY-like chemotaxis protein